MKGGAKKEQLGKKSLTRRDHTNGTISLTLHKRDHLPYPRYKRLSIPHRLRRLLKGPHQSIPVHFLRVSHLVRYR